ncbi:MAG: hypothetical protein EAZ96_10925 [Oscillatoriales cyanobacterium]|nr:MAG: hypothetical protein EAZ96_10925 [Oscillatoriales cyanobacterium]
MRSHRYCRGSAPVPTLLIQERGQPRGDCPYKSKRERATTGGLPLQIQEGNHGGIAPTNPRGQPRGDCPYKVGAGIVQ